MGKPTCIYLEPLSMAYVTAYRVARGHIRISEAVTEVLRLSMSGPQGLGEAWGGVVLADASAARATGEWRAEPGGARGRKHQKSVQLVRAGLISTLRRRARGASSSMSAYVNLLIRDRVWGHRRDPGERPDPWAGITAWVKIDPRDGLPIVHVLEQSRGHLATRKLGDMSRGHALTDEAWLPRLIQLMIAEGRLEASSLVERTYSILVKGEQWDVRVPGGGRFEPLLAIWETVDGEALSTWAVAYAGLQICMPIEVTRCREGLEGRAWAARVARGLNAAWCRANLDAFEGGELVFAVAAVLTAHPLDPIEEEENYVESP